MQRAVELAAGDAASAVGGAPSGPSALLAIDARTVRWTVSRESRRPSKLGDSSLKRISQLACSFRECGQAGIKLIEAFQIVARGVFCGFSTFRGIFGLALDQSGPIASRWCEGGRSSQQNPVVNQSTPVAQRESPTLPRPTVGRRCSKIGRRDPEEDSDLLRAAKAVLMKPSFREPGSNEEILGLG